MIIPAGTPEESAVYVAYLANRLGTTAQALVGNMPFSVFKVERAGRPVGALLYTNYRETTIEFTAAGEAGWMSKSTIRSMFAHPFLELRVWSLLTMVQRSNAISRTICRRLGFVELCVIPSGVTKADDIILYCMTRDKCIWITGKSPSRRRLSPFHNGVASHG